jgi:hypothetical protein
VVLNEKLALRALSPHDLTKDTIWDQINLIIVKLKERN